MERQQILQILQSLNQLCINIKSVSILTFNTKKLVTRCYLKRGAVESLRYGVNSSNYNEQKVVMEWVYVKVPYQHYTNDS